MADRFVEAVQIFESFAGAIPQAFLGEWSLTPTRRIVEGLRAKVPGARIIVFAKGSGLAPGIRRECLNHAVVFSERHLRHLLRSYMQYYNDARTHLSKDAPIPRAVQVIGCILSTPILDGLHKQYAPI
jgi:hypothetical protein